MEDAARAFLKPSAQMFVVTVSKTAASLFNYPIDRGFHWAHSMILSGYFGPFSDLPVL
jgi:hypothetical protein